MKSPCVEPPQHNPEFLVRIASERRRLVAFVRVSVIVGSVWILLYLLAFAFELIGFLIIALALVTEPNAQSRAIGILLRMLQGPGEGRVALAANSLLHVAGLCFGVVFLKYLFGRRNLDRRLRGLVPAASFLDSGIKGSLTEIASALDLSIARIHVYLSAPSDFISAYTMRVRNENYLIVSPKLALRIFQREPVAMAIAAHELAHFQQRDGEYFAIVSRFLYLSLIYSVICSPLICVRYGEYYLQMFFYCLVIGGPLWYGQLLFTRRLRHSAEKSADLAAILCGYSTDLIRALQSISIAPGTMSRSRLFNFHPDQMARIVSARDAERLLSIDQTPIKSHYFGIHSMPRWRDYFIEGSSLFVAALAIMFVWVGMVLLLGWALSASAT